MVYAKSLTANQKPGNLKFCPPFYKRFLIGWNPEGISKKGETSGLSKNQKWIFRISNQTNKNEQLYEIYKTIPRTPF